MKTSLFKVHHRLPPQPGEEGVPEVKQPRFTRVDDLFSFANPLLDVVNNLLRRSQPSALFGFQNAAGRVSGQGLINQRGIDRRG